MDFPHLVNQIETHLANGGELTAAAGGVDLSASLGPKGTYAIIGQNPGGGEILFSQGVVGVGMLLWRMEEQTDLSNWEAVAGPQ